MFIDKSMTREVITLGPDAGILEAKDLMERHRVRHIPIVEEGNFLVGIVSDRDIRTVTPPAYLGEEECAHAREKLAVLKVKDVMAKNVMTISSTDTVQDALLMMQKLRVGAFPVVDPDGRVVGILSIRDLVRAFINVLGFEEPGALLGIVVEDRQGQMKTIVDAITEEGIPFGSILVARHWEKGKRAVFPYLLTTNTVRIRKKLEKLGFELLNPLDWSIDKLPRKKD